MTLTRMWTLIGAVAVILILLAGYAAGVAPALAAADSANEEIATVELQNTVKANELADLKELSENSDKLFADLAEVQRSIPAGHETSVFASKLGELAAVAGVTLTKVTYVSAADALAPEQEAAPVAPAEGDEAEAAETDTPAPAPDVASATQPVPSVPGLVAIGVDIQISGSYAAIHIFLESVQSADRSFSVANVSVQADSALTTWEMTISGAVYVLLDGPATIVSTGEGNSVN
ncbi:MAG: hypothetical protein ACOH1M_09490 [Rhodoglobus sp.]